MRAQYGYLVGDLNTDGLLDMACHFFGEDLYIALELKRLGAPCVSLTPV